MSSKLSLILSAFGWFGNLTVTTTAQAEAPNSDISAADATKMIQDNADLIILDVRTPAEYHSGHINKAINIDFNAADFATNINKLNKTTPYLVYCRSGHRSGQASAMMKKANFTKIFNMLGGIVKWQSEKRPVVQ